MKKGVGRLLLVAVVIGFVGCGSQQPVVEKKKEGPQKTVKVPEERGAEKPPESKKEDWIVEKPNLAVAWKTLAAEVGGFLAAGKLDEAQQGIEKLDKLYMEMLSNRRSKRKSFRRSKGSWRTLVGACSTKSGRATWSWPKNT